MVSSNDLDVWLVTNAEIDAFQSLFPPYRMANLRCVPAL